MELWGGREYLGIGTLRDRSLSGKFTQWGVSLSFLLWSPILVLAGNIERSGMPSQCLETEEIETKLQSLPNGDSVWTSFESERLNPSKMKEFSVPSCLPQQSEDNGVGRGILFTSEREFPLTRPPQKYSMSGLLAWSASF